MNKTSATFTWFREIFMNFVQLSICAPSARWRSHPKPSLIAVFVSIAFYASRGRYISFFSSIYLSCGHRLCTNGRISRWIRHQQRHWAAMRLMERQKNCQEKKNGGENKSIIGECVPPLAKPMCDWPTEWCTIWVDAFNWNSIYRLRPFDHIGAWTIKLMLWSNAIHRSIEIHFRFWPFNQNSTRRNRLVSLRFLRSNHHFWFQFREIVANQNVIRTNQTTMFHSCRVPHAHLRYDLHLRSHMSRLARPKCTWMMNALHV